MTPSRAKQSENRLKNLPGRCGQRLHRRQSGGRQSLLHMDLQPLGYSALYGFGRGDGERRDLNALCDQSESSAGPTSTIPTLQPIWRRGIFASSTNDVGDFGHLHEFEGNGRNETITGNGKQPSLLL